MTIVVVISSIQSYSAHSILQLAHVLHIFPSWECIYADLQLKLTNSCVHILHEIPGKQRRYIPKQVNK
jgi:hypothetical protein